MNYPSFQNHWRQGCSRLMLLLLGVGTLAGAEPKRVLLLHSFGREFAPYDSFAAGFRTELVRQSSTDVDIFEVSLESARFQHAPEAGPIVNYLRAMFAGRSLDLVVPIGGPAARFAQMHRPDLFAGTPLLLTGVDERHLQMTSLTTNDAVVAIRFELAGALASLLQVLPQTTNVAVVIGDSPVERFWLQELRREFEPFTDRVGFNWLNQMSLKAITDHCANLPPRSAIFYALLAIDAEGIPHLEERALAALHNAANAPIVGLMDTQLGRGILGGPLAAIGELSRSAAQRAVRILEGESPGAIRTPSQGPAKPSYDWRELRRWGISETRLPADSEVRFREPSLWQRYRVPIMLGVPALLIQGIIITFLLLSRRSRRRAEESLRESSARMAAILDTAVEGIITIDERGIIESVNPATPKLFGYLPAEMIGQSISLLLPTPFREIIEPHLTRCRATGEWPVLDVGREVTGQRKDGSVFPIDLEVREVRLAGRRIYTVFGRDITDRKRAETAAREFGGRLLHAQEAERARLGRELHDDITQRLARLAIDAGRAETDSANGVHREIMQGLRNGLVRLSEDVHALSYRLHPAILEDLGLREALKVECERFSRQESIRTELDLDGAPANVPLAVGLGFFRVSQEALRNAARHAQTQIVRLSLRGLDGGLQLAIADNGVGFDPGKPRERPSLGLASMGERIRLLGGELDIESTPGHGTIVVAWVPLNE